MLLVNVVYSMGLMSDPSQLMLFANIRVGALLLDGSKASRILGGDQKEVVSPEERGG